MQRNRTAFVRARSLPGSIALGAILLAGCANPDKRTLAELHRVEADMSEVQVANGLDEAMRGYRRFLEEAPESALTPEAMRRLADLKLEKEYGILGGDPATIPAPPASLATSAARTGDAPPTAAAAPGKSEQESEQEFEQRSAAREVWLGGDPELALPGGEEPSDAGPLEAITLYDRILATYPDYEHNDRVLYQKARAYDELGRPDEAIRVTQQLIAAFPDSRHIDEVQFRRAEYFFTRKHYLEAEEAYSAITRRGPVSSFYELALYKLGWTLYKQEMHEEALDQYVALLDYKVSTGYDFDQSEDEDAGRRIADTFRVVSLSFSNIGGSESVESYFVAKGQRPYEDRVYRHLGEFYFEKLRYQDAASSYETFVGLHPQHRSAPYFGMRVVEIYQAGDFRQLVLASKKEFAARYGLAAEYWHHFPIEEAPEVVSYLKGNLRDLANYYHEAYQNPELADEQAASFGEAQQWYRAFLASFAQDAEAPVIHQQLAELLLEHEDFGQAALEYEHTAYDYPQHDLASKAGYSAIFAHRQQQQRVQGEQHEAVRQAAVVSTLRFVEAFPAHEHAAVVLGDAVDDLFKMQQFERAIEVGRQLLDAYPEADGAVLRSAWLAIAHSAFGLDDYPQAEQAYARVLEMTAQDDDSRQSVVDNLAASIYQQGELASKAEDHRAAAEHFLRIAKLAPDSAIRPSAEYDAGAALIQLQDWDAAVAVLDAFREAHPDHELHGEATKQLARVYREQGELELAAVEFERIAADAEDEELRREALLAAGELYEEAKVPERAIAVYLGYVERYPAPLELAVETRFKIATIHQTMGNQASQHDELRRIVELDRSAGAERTERLRYLAAQSALVLTEGLYDLFAEVKLVQPFERSLQEKQRRMDTALSGFGRLVDYEVGEVTAAATYYMAEIYRDFSASLLASERPTDLSQAELLDYEGVLEEEAFPFEEKAITVHEKNLELMAADVYNRWIEKSLGKLAELMPGRYAKFEQSSGALDSLDRYAYQAPTAAPAVLDDALAAAQASEPSGVETLDEVQTVEAVQLVPTPEPATAAPPAAPLDELDTLDPPGPALMAPTQPAPDPVLSTVPTEPTTEPVESDEPVGSFEQVDGPVPQTDTETETELEAELELEAEVELEVEPQPEPEGAPEEPAAADPATS